MSNLGRRRGLSSRARLAWFVVVACLVCVGVIGPHDPEQDSASAVLNAVLVIGALGGLLVVGALLVTRVPGNAIGSWLVLAGALVTVSAVAHFAQAAGAVMEPVPWPGAAWAALLGALVEVVPIAIVTVIVPLHFPDGRLPSPRWRWVQRLMVLAIASSTVASLFGPGPYGTADLANPLYAPGLAPLLDALGAVALLAAVPAFLGSAASMVVRYRHAGHVERQQMKWLAAVAAIAGVAFPASFIVPNETASFVLYTIGYASLAALPLAIGAAILRYRLYDIDHFISRTVSWTVTSAVSVAVFVGGLLALQYLLSGVTQAQTLAVAGVDPAGSRPVPATPPARPAGRRPAIRPHGGGRRPRDHRVREPAARRGGPRHADPGARDHGRRRRPPGFVPGVASSCGRARVDPLTIACVTGRRSLR